MSTDPAANPEVGRASRSPWGSAGADRSTREDVELIPDGRTYDI